MSQELFRDAKACVAAAKLDYQKSSIDELANKYCEAIDNNDQANMNLYISALMLRFWFQINKLQQKSPGIQDYEEFACWLYEAITYACKYRAWQNPDKHCNAQQAITRCIDTIRHQHYYEYNLDKHRANYNTVSFDTPVATDKDGNENTLGDLMEDEDIAIELKNSNFQDGDYIVQYYLDHKKPIEAIILDTIMHNEVNRYTKKTVKRTEENGTVTKYVEHYVEFWLFRCVQILNSLSSSYDKYFAERYNIKTAELEAALNKIRTSTNQKLYKYVGATLEDAKKVLGY